MSGSPLGTAVAGAFGAARRSTAPPQNQADRSGQDDAKRQAWLREMERAQLAGWFLPTGREAVRSGPAMKSPVISEPSRALTAVAHHHGFSNSTSNGEARQVAPVSQSESGPVAVVRAPSQNDFAAVQSREMSSAESTTASVQAPSGMRGLVEQSMQSGEAFAHAHRQTFTAAHYPAAGLVRGGEHPLLAASSATAQETPALPMFASQTQVQPQVFLNSLGPARWEPAVNTQWDGVPFAQKAAQETNPQEGSRLSSQATQRNAATRIHTQWTFEGMTLWIGMDGTARQVELQAQAIVSTLLRTFNSQGQRLSRVVCNGTVVFDCQDPEANSRHLADFSSFLHQDTHIRMSSDISSPNFQPSKEKQ
jgi:hypothetical protein